MRTQARWRKLLALGSAPLIAAILLALSFRHDTEQVLRWVKEHLLNPPAVTALGTMLLVAAALVGPLRKRQRRRSGSQAGDRAARDRKTMLRRVRYQWITGVLEHSLADAAQLALGLQRRPDAVVLGSQAIRRPGRPSAPIPHGTPITEIFDEVGSTLLILGAPGAGKTTLLLQLADGLLKRAEDDRKTHIPVVLNLASWAPRHEPLDAWLAEQLAISYNVPRLTASAWIERDALALLLDGLDEVTEARRAECARAINIYRDAHGLVPIAVCSRTEELKDLAVSLRLDEAVELLPPTDAQIDSYLGHLEATGTPLGDVRTAFATDEDLRDLLRSPLMLHVITLAYHGQPAAALYEPGSIEQRRTRLWQQYVTRMFEQRPLQPEYDYTAQRAKSWLGWLARTMRRRGEAEFRLDRLDPQWIPDEVGMSPLIYIDWLLGLIAVTADIELGDVVLVSWTRLAGGFCFGVAYFAFFGAFFELMTWVLSHEPLLTWLAVFKVGGLGPALAVALAFGMLGGLGKGMHDGLDAGWHDLGPGWRERETDRREKAALAETGRRAARYGLLTWSVAGLAAGLGTGSATGLAFGLAPGLLTGLAVGIAVALATGLVCGGAASLQRHLVRTVLARAGVAPRRYEAFLEAMTERLLLRRSGNAYLFIHRLLLEYLAESARGEDLLGDDPTSR